jgi:hypothetical protein
VFAVYRKVPAVLILPHTELGGKKGMMGLGVLIQMVQDKKPCNTYYYERNHNAINN